MVDIVKGEVIRFPFILSPNLDGLDLVDSQIHYCIRQCCSAQRTGDNSSSIICLCSLEQCISYMFFLPVPHFMPQNNSYFIRIGGQVEHADIDAHDMAIGTEGVKIRVRTHEVKVRHIIDGRIHLCDALT